MIYDAKSAMRRPAPGTFLWTLSGLTLAACAKQGVAQQDIAYEVEAALIHGETYAFQADGIPFQPENADADIFYTVETPPVYGTLTLDGKTLATGDRFTHADIAAGRVLYGNQGTTPGAEEIRFVVNDTGLTFFRGLKVTFTFPGQDEIIDSGLAQSAAEELEVRPPSPELPPPPSPAGKTESAAPALDPLPPPPFDIREDESPEPAAPETPADLL